jgi:aspartyl-tRNA(Asn)/glutamyl-tRNA(Gln) amidotransferase subunit C
VKITKEQVLHVARLSSLSLEPGEEERVASELSRILDYVEGLAAVQLPPSGIVAREETDQMTSMDGDLPAKSLPSSAVFLNAPDNHGGFFRVPRIVEEGR